MGVRRRYIRQTVARLLQERGIIMAPIDVEQIARQYGIIVVYKEAEDELSGFLYRDLQNDSVIIGVNPNHHWRRQRFTIAHELGHYLLHDTGAVHVDRADNGYRLRLRNHTSSTGTDEDEREANFFAAELLMPLELLERDLDAAGGSDLLDLLEVENSAYQSLIGSLASKYQVSPQALTYRLTDLGFTEG